MRWWSAATAAAVAIAATAVHAQALRCRTTSGEVCDKSGCRQVRVFEVRRYPADAHFQLTVSSADARSLATVLHASDALLEEHAALDTSRWNTTFQSTKDALPLPLTYGSAYQAANLSITSYDACKALAGMPEATGPVFLDNRLVVAWDGGQAQCTSRVVCFP